MQTHPVMHTHPDRRVWFITLAVFGFALLVLTIAQIDSLEEEMTHDSAHYLELARSLLRGDGFQTQTHWALNIPGPDLPRADTYRAPLFPLLTAALSTFTGGLFTAAKWVSVLSGAMIPALVFLFAHRRFGLSLPLSAIAAVIATLHHHLVISATRPLTESAYTAAITTALFLVTGPRPRPFLGGILTGLSWLLRYQALLVVPCALLAISVPGTTRRRWLIDAALYGLGFLIVSGPWMIRNARVAGSPFYTDLRYHMVSTYDRDMTTYHYFHGLTAATEPLDYMRAHADQTVDHFIRSIKKIGRTFPQENAGNTAFGVAALMGGFAWIITRRGQWRLQLALAYFGAANILLVAMAFVDHRHLTSLDPIVVLLLANLLGMLWKAFPHPFARIAAMTAIAGGLVWEVSRAYEAIVPFKPQYYEFARAPRDFLVEHVGRDEGVMGEKPYYLSWVLDRKATSLPWCSDEEFLELARRFDVRYACIGGFNRIHFGRPYPGSFLESGEPPSWLVPVLEFDDPPLVVYEICEPNVMANAPDGLPTAQTQHLLSD